jgi:hypothetical protein
MPDLDLIKQPEEVTISALERPAWRFAAISKRGDHRRAQVLVVLIWQLMRLAVIWLQKQPRSGRGLPVFRRGCPAMLLAAPGGSTNRATWATEPLLCEIR